MMRTIRFAAPKPKRPRHWSAFGEKERRYVLERDRHQCQLRLSGCEGYTNAVDHIVSREDGGTDQRDNLQAACPSCNRRKWSASGFFSEHIVHEQAPADFPPRSRWSVIRADYSRKERTS